MHGTTLEMGHEIKQALFGDLRIESSIRFSVICYQIIIPQFSGSGREISKR